MKNVDLSIVIPAFNEEESIERCRSEVVAELEKQAALSWEMIFVDDHSIDETPSLLKGFAESDPRIHYLRLSRNEGSHVAIAAGLNHSRGDCAIVMAADLQDPAEEIHRMTAYWAKGYHVVWMVRNEEEPGYSPSSFGRMWYWIARRLPGVSDMPPTGSDMFLLDHRVIDSLQGQNLRKIALTLVVRSLGFRQINLLYAKKERAYGESKWTLKQKLLHTTNTIMSFTNIPVRAVTVMGFAFSAVAFAYSLLVFILKFIGKGSTSGWHSLMFVNALSFGLIMLAIGILGEYIWRIFENTRHAPHYIVEESSDESPTEAGGGS